MSLVRKLSFSSALALVGVGTLAVLQAWAANDRVQFPENYKDGVHCPTARSS